ncbi:substrate-binding domain-containing protein [Streptomyces thermocarboxydus]
MDAERSRVGQEGPYTPEETAGLHEVLRRTGATAAVLHGDVDALMLVQRLADHGVRVPEDCSVVAYDDVVAGLGDPAHGRRPAEGGRGPGGSRTPPGATGHGDGRAHPGAPGGAPALLSVRGSTLAV